ncbi:MAG: ATP-binding protein [Candidatus Rokuibacteriota bacterium]
MGDHIVVARDQPLRARLERLAREPRLVFVAGLPGTGKSLVIHQLAHLAAGAGRSVHLLQWDVARPVFEASDAARRYPIVEGVTHALIRKAVGLWARRALVEWERRCPGSEHLLVGETPLVGGRLIELARPVEDAAEPILAARSCRFAIPVPSAEVRLFLEAERDRRTARPAHPREREDAHPRVLRSLWRELLDVAGALGIPLASRGAEAPYDPSVYRRVYETVLRHRHVDVVELDTVLPTSALSVYDFAVPCAELVPDAAEANAAVRDAEARHPDAAALAREAAQWFSLGLSRAR